LKAKGWQTGVKTWIKFIINSRYMARMHETHLASKNNQLLVWRNINRQTLIYHSDEADQDWDAQEWADQDGPELWCPQLE
jgi:hypothetical protein